MFQVKIATTESELNHAFLVRRKVFVEEQGVPLSLEVDEFDKTASHFVVYKNHIPIGAGRIREVKPGVGKVERVSVLAEHRGNHYGKRIMHALESHGRDLGFQKIILNAQSHALSFYESIGYTTTSPEFMDANIPHRAMEKKLFDKS